MKELANQVQLTFTRSECLAISLALGDFLLTGLMNNLINPDDWDRWEQILHQFLRACDAPYHPQYFVRHLHEINQKISESLKEQENGDNNND